MTILTVHNIIIFVKQHFDFVTVTLHKSSPDVLLSCFGKRQDNRTRIGVSTRF